MVETLELEPVKMTCRKYGVIPKLDSDGRVRGVHDARDDDFRERETEESGSCRSYVILPSGLRLRVGDHFRLMYSELGSSDVRQFYEASASDNISQRNRGIAGVIYRHAVEPKFR